MNKNGKILIIDNQGFKDYPATIKKDEAVTLILNLETELIIDAYSIVFVHQSNNKDYNDCLSKIGTLDFLYIFSGGRVAPYQNNKLIYFSRNIFYRYIEKFIDVYKRTAEQKYKIFLGEEDEN